jgi:hypothetical protein
LVDAEIATNSANGDDAYNGHWERIKAALVGDAPS